GHRVTLFEKHDELGGAMLYVCLVPGKEKMRWYLDWIRDQVLDLGVDIRLGHAPSVDELRGFDLVLNATGARSFVPQVAGDASRVVPFEEAMACPKVNCECHPGGRRMRKLGARVLLWGDSYAATDTAAFLADIGKDLTIVTENREFAADCEVIHMYVLRKRFAQGDAEVLSSRPFKFPVKVITSTTVESIDGTTVVLRDRDFARTTIEVDDVVTCHTRPEIGLFAQLRAAGVNVVNVGDAVRPRNLYWAVKEGSDFGLAVDEHLLFNPNGAILDNAPLDVLAQLTREEGPSYTAERMRQLAAAAKG
ncbi:MAG: hypothetical protein H6Q36_1462, partial [Chloroflexi bacterium]|nr:hypothetical protein [Chloroflexota bacterium]